MVLKYRNAYLLGARLALVTVALLGCRELADGGDPRTCQQTYEFGNTGCLEVTGQVVDAKGQPLKGVPMFGRAVPDTGAFVFVLSPTDSLGRFRARAMRMLGQPTTRRDSMRVYIGAFWPPSLTRDSIFVTVTVAPVGGIPDPVDIRIVLPVR